MTPSETKTAYLNECVDKMRTEGIQPTMIDTFSYYYRQVANGANGLLFNKDIQPLDIHEIIETDCPMGCRKAGTAVLPKTVRIVLNGGLGTSMGLTQAKSLMKAKDNLSFLEILLAQAQIDDTALCFMNSFSTHDDTVAEMERLKPNRLPRMFIQHKFPKILQENLCPAQWPPDPRLEWNPPGHGDVYISLYTSGLLQALLKEGIEYAFISNSDNLGASLDLQMLGYFSQFNLPFMMEVSRRKPSDAKGGHLALHCNGRMVLRESAQCPAEEVDAFQDVSKFRFFNTNNIWVNLSFLYELIKKEGFVPLPLILNAKTLDPRDENSPPVFQIETAMGSAISLFDGATAVLVPRSRFMPVKSCQDLLILRSDRYQLDAAKRLIRNPNTKFDSIRVNLDSKYYKKIDAFDQRFAQGPPSLVDCKALVVKGNIFFGKNVRILGDVVITNPTPEPVTIPDGAVIQENLTLKG